MQLAAANARSSAADEFNRLPDPKPVEPMELLDRRLAELPVDVKIDFAKEVENAARRYDPRVTQCGRPVSGTDLRDRHRQLPGS